MSGTGFSCPRKGLRKTRPLQISQLVKQREVEDNAQTASVFTDKSVNDSSTGKAEITSEGPDLGWSSGGDFNPPPDLGWPTIESGKEENFERIQRDRSASFYEDDEKVKRAMEGSASKTSSFKSWWLVRLRSRKQREDKKTKEKKNGLKPNELLALDEGLRDARAASQNQTLDSSDIEKCDEDSQQRTVKILLIGDTGVGKSCLMSRFCENKFSCNLPGTVSVGFAVHEMDIANEHIRVNCWDIPGQEPYRTITRSYYRGCHGVIIVYDVSVTHTFERVVYWMNNVKKNAGPNVNICLVGNKADLSSVVETEAAIKVAQEYRMEFFLVSAKSGENVYKAFMAIIEKCLQTSQFWGCSLQHRSDDIQLMMTPPSQVEDGQVQKRNWKRMCVIS